MMMAYLLIQMMTGNNESKNTKSANQALLKSRVILLENKEILQKP